jgi:hypothetical protein
VDLLEALAEVSRAGEAWIDGSGHLEGVELKVAGEASDPVRALKGRFTLLHLAGPSGGPYAVTLARASEAGIEVRGGMLIRARSAGVTLAVHACTVAAPVPAVRATSSDVRGQRAEAEAARTPASPPQPVWARVAAANAAAAERDEEEEVEPAAPEAGDLVDHFAFGVCEVLTSDGDRLKIRDVGGPGGRIREVSLSMLRVVGPTEVDGKRQFRLVRKGAGV